MSPIGPGRVVTVTLFDQGLLHSWCCYITVTMAPSAGAIAQLLFSSEQPPVGASLLLTSLPFKETCTTTIANSNSNAIVIVMPLGCSLYYI